MTEYVGIKPVKFNQLKLSYDDDKTEISISHLYALFVQAGVEQNAHSVPETALMDMKKENDIKENKNKEDMVKSFADKLRQRSGSGNSIEHVSGYLGRKTAQSAKKNMDSLASNIQRYYSINSEENLEESEILELCSFYGKIIDQYLLEPAGGIPDDLSNQYKLIATKYQKTCR